MTESSSVLNWILFFYIYCFLGWCVESTYVSCFQKKWVNRGFMHGPYIPLYGTGALMVTYITLPIKHSVVLTFVIGAIAASILEYVTGVLMEAIFKVRYWDYSEHRFNINGHVCLLNTIEWGFLSIFLVFILDHPVAAIVNYLAEPVQLVLVSIISIIFWSDFAVSVKAAFDVRDMIIHMTQAKEEIYRLQRRLDVLIAVADDSFENWKEEKMDMMEDRMEALEERLGIMRNAKEERRAGRRELMTNMQERFQALKGKTWAQKEEKNRFMDEFREELESLKEKFSLERRKDARFENHLRRHKKSLLLNSPTATSREFKEAFEELVAQVEEKYNNKKKEKQR